MDQYYEKLEKDYHLLHTVLLNISKRRELQEIAWDLAGSALREVHNPRVTAEECRETARKFYLDNEPKDRSNGGWGG